MKIPLPPLEEQRAIATRIRGTFELLQDAQKQINNERATVDVLKQSLLRAAFAGELSTNGETETAA